MAKCIRCGKPAYAIDAEYDEGYCQDHFEEQQRSLEPIEYVQFVED